MQDSKGPSKAVYCAHVWIDAAVMHETVISGIETFRNLPEVVALLEVEEKRLSAKIDEERSRLAHAYFGPSHASMLRKEDGTPDVVECGGYVFDCVKRES